MSRVVNTSNLDYPNGGFRDESYFAYDKDNCIGIAVHIGHRQNQEDRVVTGSINLDRELTDQQWETVLCDTISMLEEKLPDKNAVDQGSCLAAVILVGNKAHVANLGDSYILSAVVEKDEKTVITRLNKLHSTTNKDEQERILEAGGMISRFSDGALRLNDCLNLTRAIGDRKHDGSIEDYDDDYTTGKGLSHEPDIYHYTVDIPKDGKAFLGVACDGIFETLVPGTSNKNFETLVPKASKETFENLPDCGIITQAFSEKKDCNELEIATAVIEAAYNSGSQDNLSTVIIKVTPLNQNIYFGAVFDGHGGSFVSQYGEHNFPLFSERSLTAMMSTL